MTATKPTTTKELKTLNIKGKDYVPVNERIKYFREHYKDGRITTELVSCDEKSVIIKANIYIGDVLVASDYAQEDRSSSMVNSTSYVENCSTSAVGRALGIFGIGIDTSVATYGEVLKAITQQEMRIRDEESITLMQQKIFLKEIEELNIPLKRFLDVCGVSSIEEIKHKDCSRITELLDKQRASVAKANAGSTEEAAPKKRTKKSDEKIESIDVESLLGD